MMKNKIFKIINEVIIESIDCIGRGLQELVDNDGGVYLPMDIDPKVVRLFENADNIYRSSLDDDYWKKISDKFPGYNTEDSQTKKAVEYILSNMKKKYPHEDWGEIENAMRDKIADGIT